MLNNFVTYVRVSTDKQGVSGLGLEAQEQAVNSYISKQHNANLLSQFTEVETGTRKGIRPQLAQALALCKQQKATLVIAKLDRLARNVAFIANLMEANVDFVALDIPNANKLTLHVMAAMAELEADRISQRTKEALQQAKKRGKVLGNPQNLVPKYMELGRENAAKARKNDAKTYADSVFPTIFRLKSAHYSLSKIATHLNTTQIPSASGKLGVWDARKVQNVINWAQEV